MGVATNFDRAMTKAASFGHIDIVKHCKEWGATDFDRAIANAAFSRHIDIVKLCREWRGF